jgi:2-iminobutanoate/2-iminopropanoate deaminase
MNRRIFVAFAALVMAACVVAFRASSQSPQGGVRKAIHLPSSNLQLPFSDGILSGNTLYLAGRIGLDPKTGQAPPNIDDEIKNLLDGVKETLVASGMTMDDLVYVQVSCTDLALYDKFNASYKTYFTSKDFPAREFVGVATLLRGGHFELQSIAVRRPQ